MADTQERKVILESSDKKTFEVSEPVANKSKTVRGLLSELEEDEQDAKLTVPLPNVSARVLSKVIEYCKNHVEFEVVGEGDKPAKSEEEVKKWDEEFIKVDKRMLFELILAGNYLHIQGLTDLASMTVADLVRGKSPEEIRATFSEHAPQEQDNAEDKSVGKAKGKKGSKK